VSTFDRSWGWGSFLLYARAEWRTKWRSHVVLAGVAAIAVAAVVATLTAATRSETAFQRLRFATHASDVSAFFPDAASAVAAVGAVERIDGVESAAADAGLSVRPVGSDYIPDYDLYARAPLAAGSDVNTPVITAGRSVNPGRPDEMVVSEDFAADLGVSVGDTVTLESMTTRWVEVADNGGDPGPPDGPKVKVVVVGLSRTPADFARWDGLLHLSPAFVERYGSQLRVSASVEIRLSQQASRLAVRRAVGELAKDVEGDSAAFGGDAATDDGLSAIATALRIIAAVAALAGAVVLVLALARATRLSLGDHRTLVALGWTSRQLAVAAVLVFSPWVLLGVGVGVVGGALVAPQVMVGLARSVDPAPGSIVVDRGVVLAVGLVAVAFGLLVVGFAARRLAASGPDRVRLPTRVIQLGHPLPMVIGVRHALAGEADHGGRSSRVAMIVMAAGLAGAVAALIVSASISRLQTDPSLIGQGQGRVIDSGESVDVYDRALPRLENDRRVAMLAGVHLVFGISVVRSQEFPVLAYDIRRGDLGVSVVSGRIARQPDELALGPKTLDQVGKGIGDRIDLRGETGTATFRIVGVVLFPEGDFDHAAGIALTATGADRLVGDTHDAGALHQIVFDWADGVDARAADQQLAASGLQVLTNDNALKPASVTNLGQVTTLPRYLAVFLGIMSLATLGHALSVSVRRRSRELATLRALGMTPRASSAVVVSHALTLAGIAIVVGVPAGLVIGTRIWRPIAEGAHVVVRSVAPGSWIALHLLAMVVATGVLTAIPAWGALRLRAADTLRDE
jgi:hypothetical protein